MIESETPLDREKLRQVISKTGYVMLSVSEEEIAQKSLIRRILDNGKIVQHGTHRELIRKNGIYRTFVEGRQEAASWKLSQAGA